MSDIEIHAGSSNVFADLGLPDAEELQLKANLAATLRQLIKAQNLTQTAAAKRLGIGQADLSKLLTGNLRGYTAERLMGFLTAFDQDVEITMRPHAKAGERGRITFTPALA